MNTLRIPSTHSRLDIPSSNCKVCKKPFIKFNTLQSVCGRQRCLVKVGPLKRKEEAAELKKRKEAVKSRSQWMKEAQSEFNRYIRFRDLARFCISCGSNHQGQWHAGHYLSTGARPELRFDERNVHKQCQPCNTHLHGNLLAYRVGLIGRIGLAAVESLEGPSPPRKFTIRELMDIKGKYRRLSRQLEQASEAVTL